MAISDAIRAELLTMLDTVDAIVWRKRGDESCGKTDVVNTAVQTIALMLAQMQYSDSFNSQERLVKARLLCISNHAILLPIAYQFAEQSQGGCMRPELVSENEVDFAVATVLSSLIEHHNFELPPVGSPLRASFVGTVRPDLHLAIKHVLELRNAMEF